ncbi:MAG: MFS transporter [Ilumatobacteraceae bacterium]
MTELRVRQPALSLRLFRDRLFRAVNVSAALLYAGFFGLLFVLPIYLQTLRGYSAFRSGLVQSPQALGIVLVSFFVGQRAYQAIGPRRLMAVCGLGAALASCGYALLTLTTPLIVVAGLSFVRGLTMGFVFISIQTAVYATTSHADTGRATSLFNTQRQISYAAGVAIAATVLTGGLNAAGGSAAQRLPAHQHAFLAVGLAMVPGALLALLIRDDDVAETRRPPEPVDEGAAP